MNPVRVGIIGAGLMGRWHGHAAKRLGAQIVGIADRSESAAVELGKRLGCRQIYGSGQDLLKGEQVDALHVCTPLDSHAELVRAGIQAGVNVLVEKPLAPDAATTRALCDEARERQVLLCPVLQFPFQAGFRRARAGISAAGTLRHLEMTVCSAGGIGRGPQGLESLVAEVLPHPLSIVQALLPGGLEEAEWSPRSPRPGEFLLQGQIRDVSVNVTLSLASRPTENSLRLRGEDGTWLIDLFHGYGYFLPGSVSRARKIRMPFEQAVRSVFHATKNLTLRGLQREPAYPGLKALIHEFHRAIRSEVDAPIDLGSTLRIAQAQEAILRESTRP
jgi:predicted dehydrogenase